MSAQVQAQVKPTPMPMPSLTRAPSGLVQHKCVCGGSHGLGGECDECRQKRLRVQRRAVDAPEFPMVPTVMLAHSAFSHDFGRVSVTNVRARLAGDEQEKRGEQEADRAAAQVEQGIAPALTTSPTPLVIRRRALEEEEETFAEDIASPEIEATETAAPTAAQAMPEAASPATEPRPEAEPMPEPEAAPSESAAEARGGGLIVEDGAALSPGQMTKGAFLDEMRAAACAVADAELAAVGRSTEGCPYIERWIDYYRTRDSAHIERAIRRYAPETAGVTSAREYIPLVSERIRQGVARWARTGEISGVPEELVSQLSGAGLLEGIGGAVSSTVSGVGSLFFKAREGGAKEVEPQTIRAQLGGGSPLDNGVRARMGSAFGHDFSRVRVHTDGQAANLSSSLNARAFTIGSDVAFGAGEYQPGTLIGDALLAHELAHVVQQGGTDSSSPLFQKGETTYNALEHDADVSAVGAVVSLWSGAKGGLAKIAQNAMPRLRAGLGLQRCAARSGTTRAPTTTAPTTSTPTPSAPATGTPSGAGATPCPTTVSVGAIAQRNHSDLSSADKERIRTELGAMSRMDVGPGPDHTGHCMKESLTTISNTCPATWSDGTPNRPCTGNRCLYINRYGTMWGLHDGPTSFFDMHRTRAPFSVLEGTGVSSCTIVCEQTYTCDRIHPTTGVFRITRNFQVGSHTRTDGTSIHITTGTVTKT